jgi:hypothetical protein
LQKTLLLNIVDFTLPSMQLLMLLDKPVPDFLTAITASARCSYYHQSSSNLHPLHE